MAWYEMKFVPIPCELWLVYEYFLVRQTRKIKQLDISVSKPSNDLLTCILEM